MQTSNVKVSIDADALGQVCQRDPACTYEIVNILASSATRLSSSLDTSHRRIIVEYDDCEGLAFQVLHGAIVEVHGV